MKKFLASVVSFALLFSVCSFFETQAEEKLLSQTSFMISVAKGTTTYVERFLFTNLLDQESKYTVSVTRKPSVEIGLKVELDGFSVQEKYDVGPLQPKTIDQDWVSAFFAPMVLILRVLSVQSY